MRHGFSRRAWLLGVFSGLAGLLGLGRKAMATPKVARPETTSPPFSPTVQSFAYDRLCSLVSVTTHTYDATARLTAMDPLGQVTTYTYFYEAQNRLA